MIDAETAENNPDIEKQWAVKTFEHAETYSQTLIATIPQRIILTTKETDDKIYLHFRNVFPLLNVNVLDEEEWKSETGKATWRLFVNVYEGVVEDWNFGSMVRVNASNPAYGDEGENAMFVTRVQFCAVEIARNREGCNDGICTKVEDREYPRSELEAMGIKELKRLLGERSIDCGHCLYKEDLVELLV